MFKILKDKQFIKRYFQIAFPMMLQTLVAFIVTFLDNIMIGGVSNEAVSAVYAVNQLSFLFFVTSFGLFSGAGIYVQQFFGAKDINHLRQSFLYKVVMGAAFLIVVMPLLYLFGHHLVAFYSRNDANQVAIIAEAKRYMPIIFLSYIPFVFTISYATTFREMGQTKLPMIATVIALITNGSLNAIFIYGLQMGVVGAALATVIARVVEMIFFITIAHHRQAPFCHRVYRNFHIDPKLFKLITLKTIPLLINEILWSLGMIMQSLSFATREGVLSSLAILSTTSEIFGIIFSGLGVGTAVMVGSTLGAGKIDEAKQLSKKLMQFGVFISVIIGSILIISAPFIPKLWVEVALPQQQLATKMMIVHGCFLWIYSFSVSSYQTLRAGGMATHTMLMDAGMMWFGTVPFAWALALGTQLPLLSIFILIQIVDIIKMGVGIYFVKKGKWANNLTKQVNQPEFVVVSGSD